MTSAPASRGYSARTLITIAAVIAMAAVVPLAGCASKASSAPPAAGDKVPSPVRPALWDLTTPEKAVKSYLDWTTIAYRMANSDLASRTADPNEQVHVDSYVELNKENGNKGIDQHLQDFQIVSSSREGTAVIIVTKETWAYRYFSLADQTYITPRYTARYDATYTVGAGPAGGWVVAAVQATALDPVH